MEEMHQGLDRVGRNTAIGSRVEVPPQGAHRYLGVAHAAQRRVHRGISAGVVGHVTHQDDIGLGPLGFPLEHIVDDVAPTLLLALEDEMDVEGRLAGGIAERLIRPEKTEDLAFVVCRTAGVQLAVPNRRREGRCDPFVERIDRLNVVVAVDQQRRGPGDRRAFGPDHRLPVSLDEGRYRAAQAPKISE